MSSDRLINELKDAFDRLDEIELQLAERKQSRVRLETNNGEVISYSLTEIANALSKAFGALESVRPRINSFSINLRFINRSYLFLVNCYKNCITFLKKVKFIKELEINTTFLLILKLRLIIFKALNIERIFQFIEPRLYHSNFSKGL